VSVGIRPGDRAPQAPLLDASGRETSLAAFRGEAVVLVYLRHLG